MSSTTANFLSCKIVRFIVYNAFRVTHLNESSLGYRGTRRKRTDVLMFLYLPQKANSTGGKLTNFCKAS